MRGPALVACAAALAIASPAIAAPDACGPSVNVTGDADAAAPIRASLAARGLGEVAAADCPAMQVVVERAGPRLRVSVTDGYGRRSRREVRDSATAVALIESWARPEVVGDDLPGAAPAVEEAAPAPRARAAHPASIALLGGADYARDGTAWMRAGAAGCVAAGPVCVGARLELATPIDPGFHPRRTISIAATAEWPLRAGRVALVPGAGVGGGFATLDSTGPAHPAVDVTSLRALATVALRVGLAARWAIELEVGGEAELVSGAVAVPGSLGRAALGVRYGGR